MSTIQLESLPREIAAKLLEIGAVALRPEEPFTWTSGLKSPIYCDNRLTMSYPEIRELIAEGFAAVIRRNYPDADAIAGTATAGIPHAAWAAQKLNLPMSYIRDKAKGHGKQNLIEGRIAAGQKVVVIEDLISTGGSSLKAAQAVREAGAEVLAVLAIFTYQFKQASDAFAEASVPLETLSSYSALIDVAAERGVVRSGQIDSLKAWREDPQGYGK
ncbi:MULTISPECIES: orotate phosphoribosyltransferase [unclassified Paenibacillus]|uniref:orotate phosphoribosyltransferase n=1 Tax=unclassified Paenibacillus TaxID=185978 RepID=UPI0009563EAB|nr:MULTISPECIES: orotate phosphoribosyltransferase [unclassified Paenibacillus]ASS65928.1 orotate phosphoribosyltransferase [Paenibacillus sp. RUD330]SIQ18451.1 orotate phosphoribosyltransferase [Paenibacillus sp. RU4X]SIQ40216.1 orotate phosphoribosyltransferase [Paenibacillus sp. RU4T]